MKENSKKMVLFALIALLLGACSLTVDSDDENDRNDGCSDNPCDENAVCGAEGEDFICTCNDGWAGDGFTCEDIDECADGIDNCDDAHGTCTNTEGGFTCGCAPGWGLEDDGLSCADIDECADGIDDCHENAACTNMPGGFECRCNPPMVGDGTECVILAFLLTEWNNDAVYQWTPHNGNVSHYHSQRANDVDYNPAEGSEHAWLADHIAVDGSDSFMSFVPGSAVGYDALYPWGADITLKHVVVYNGEILVTHRNIGNIRRYTIEGVEIDTITTGYTNVQGMAVANGDLYVTVYDGTSSFLRYDESFTVQETIPMPTGMVGANPQIWDFAYAPGLERFFGLAYDGNATTSTRTPTITEFVMGGEVVNTHTIPFDADGIGIGIGPLAREEIALWSDDFTTDVPATQEQCDRWVEFREVPRFVLGARMFGTYDMVGITCSDMDAAQQIADALREGTEILIPCDGYDWNVCAQESRNIWIDPPSSCSTSNCPNPGYLVRPCILSANYGGVGTATCIPPTQTMSVEFTEIVFDGLP